MKRIVCGLLALSVFAGDAGPGHADYTFTTLDVPGSTATTSELS